jgi:hypothetical protein
MTRLIAIQHVIVRNIWWLLIILYRISHNCIRLKTEFSRNTLLIWSDHHFLFEIKLRLRRNLTSQILRTSLVRTKNTIKRMLRWLVSWAVRTLFDNSRISERVDLFWLIWWVIWQVWKNSWWIVNKSWRILKMLELLSDDSMFFTQRLF